MPATVRGPDCLMSDGLRPTGLRYVARQPIMDLMGEVHGYELLFRAGPGLLAFSGDGNAATRSVLDNAVIFGLDKLTGGLPAFVNCTQEALEDRLVMVLPASDTVLELLETLEPSAALWRACAELKAYGYRLALDDFAWRPEWESFLALADYVKVDLSTTDEDERAHLMRNLNGYTAQLVAEHVETREDFAQARIEGFTLFQGYYFCKPVMMENRDIPANRMAHLEILQALHEEPLDTKRMSNLVKRDASLTYRLLRMVNSPLYGTRKVVTSIHGALVMIGDAMFRRVAMLAIASELGGDHPTELLRMAFVRGRFCELAADLAMQDSTEQYLLGVLSLLPAMLGVSVEAVAKALPLRAEVHAALMGEKNPQRSVLDWLECHEQGDWSCSDSVSFPGVLGRTGDARAKLPEMYAEAVMWAEMNLEEIR